MTITITIPVILALVIGIVVAYLLGSIPSAVWIGKSFYGIDVREKGMFKSSIEKIKCAVCPECGYVETYIENPEKIKNLVKTEK